MKTYSEWMTRNQQQANMPFNPRENDSRIAQIKTVASELERVTELMHPMRDDDKDEKYYTGLKGLQQALELINQAVIKFTPPRPLPNPKHYD